MAPRSLASGTISFGLVSIPVKLFSATQASSGVSFNLLHAKCGSRLRQQYVCARDGEKVERDDMVKGYEVAKDQYVTFTRDELVALEETASQSIEISEFVPLAAVDPVYFDRPYYLGPDRGGAKAYRLLSEAMRRSGKAALARYAARGKGYLVLLRPLDGGLVMQQLLYADEVRPFSDVGVEEAEVKDAEVQLALKLVEQTASDTFHPEAYRDEVRARTLALIEQKVKGQQIQAAPAEEPRAQVIDLVEALKQSLAAARHSARPERSAAESKDEGPSVRPERSAAESPSVHPERSAAESKEEGLDASDPGRLPAKRARREPRADRAKSGTRK
jgi:DNA end-binding protein Ku